MKASRALALALGATVAALASCRAPAPREATSLAPPAPAQARTVVVAGTSGDYAPWSTWSGARPEGLAPSLFGTFASASSYEPHWTRFAWTGVTGDLREGRFEIAVDGMTVRPERSLTGRYTIPIAAGGAVLLVRRPSWASSLSLAELDRPAFRVAVNRGGHLERVTRAKLRSATITAVPSNEGVRALLVRGEVDALMTNTFEAPRWAHGLDGIERIGPLTSDVTAFWVRADRADLADRLDAWLATEEESGRLGEARARWLGEGAGPPAASAVFALLAATSERLALMPWVAAAKAKVGLPIEDLAQEAEVLRASKRAVDHALAERGASARPSEEAVERFFRIQIELAKIAQVRAPLAHGDDATAPSLGGELRPAIARISARMAFLAARVPAGSDARGAMESARTVLAESGLDHDRIDAVAAAIVALAPTAR
ncbi:MAG: transporter substrate-binding domain-containing protein [Deltaproteobacteria bacterium]|nr:transporter substrate-binding domain-containing protein [Deltaproteobacteria bacterium]